MAGIINSIKSRPVLLYFSLAFLFSFGAILAAVGRDGFPVTEGQLPVLIVAMLLGPSLAAVLAALVSSGKGGVRDLVARLAHWRVDLKWYAVALLTAPLSAAVVLLILSRFSNEFQPAFATTDEKAGLVLMWTLSGLMVGFFEELGWTGFAIPRMLRRSGVFATGLLVGLLWGAWHLLVNLESDTFSGVLPFLLLIARLFTWLPAFRILMVWVYQRTESQLVATLMHISLVATTGIIDPVLAGSRLLVYLLAKAAVFWILVVVFRVWSGKSPQPAQSQ